MPSAIDSRRYVQIEGSTCLLITSLSLYIIGPAVRADFRRLYPANATTPTCCLSDDNRTKVTNSVTSARSLWWHVGPYFWPTDLTRTANPIVLCVFILLPDGKLLTLLTRSLTLSEKRRLTKTLGKTQATLCSLHV